MPQRHLTQETVVLTLVLAAASLSHAGVDAYIGAQIRTAAGPPIEDGVLLIEDGRVLAVGPADAGDPNRLDGGALASDAGLRVG